MFLSSGEQTIKSDSSGQSSADIAPAAGPGGQRSSVTCRNTSTHIAFPDGVHGQQVVAVAKLELDHVGGVLQRSKLRLLSAAHLLGEVREQQGVFTHPLDGLQQVGRQVHLIAQLQLLPLQAWVRGQEAARGQRSDRSCSTHPEEGLAVVHQQSVRFGFVLTVESVEAELVLLLPETHTHTVTHSAG